MTRAREASPRQEGARTDRRSPRALLAALFVVDVAFAFQQTAVIPAIPTIRTQLAASPAWATWLLSAYLMVATVATPALARLADLHGRRRVLLWALAVFLLGSVVAATAPDITLLVVGRAIQGFGGAVFPLSLALAREHLPDDRVNRAVAVLTGAFGGGSALGFACGGILTEYLTWRAVFIAGAAVIGLAVVLACLRLPRAPGEASGGFDVPGTVLLGGAVIAVLLALTLGDQLGWVTWPVLLLFGAAVVSGALWGWWELRHHDPVVDLRVFTNRPVLLVNTASVGLGWALFGSYLLVPELVDADPARAGYGLAAGAALTGFALLPSAVLQSATGPLAGAVARRIQPRWVLTAGLVVIAGGAALLAVTTRSLPVLLVGTALIGAGAGAAIQAASAVATQAVDADVAATSSALNSTVRRFGGGLGSQVSTILLTVAAGSAAAAPPHTALATGFGILGGLALLGAVAGAAVPGSR